MTSQEKPYCEFEHTADIGLEIEGATLPELFSNAAKGMFDLICDIDAAEVQEEVDISVEAADWEELLVAWLSELLYRYSVERRLFSRFEMLILEPNRLKARIGGEPFDGSRHAIRRELKAVTYHDVRVWKVKDAWKARVIFDI